MPNGPMSIGRVSPQPPGEYLFDYASRRRYAIHKSINALA
ncbi:hypothetical protein BURPS1710A_A2452 [Burkholderia pseudomallei 1710a]|uniref:Uncharacterized protein n=1 Tax=Burkholderia pseudomallei 1710a TaxID=320371 RepID=A0A0E1VQQ1_BURPE|nr:hypothetical protein BURPS1710A_A2452 [Burkholderia pseudomallei 1710a]